MAKTTTSSHCFEQDIYAQRARDTRADDLLAHVDKLARVPDVPLSLLDGLRDWSKS